MDERDQQARRHDEENREQFAIRKEERELAAEERELERELADFETSKERAKLDIETEWRAEHAGHEPERPPAWRAPESGEPRKPKQ
jgi:hypothetical protein